MASGDDYVTLWLPNETMRERATVPAARDGRNLPPLDFIRPEYTDYLPNGEPHYAITSTRDFQRVLDGYACPRCLLIFQHRRDDCPLCPWQRDPARDISEQVHDYWLPGPSRTSAEIIESSGIDA